MRARCFCKPLSIWQKKAASVYMTFLPVDLPEMQRGTGEDDVSGDIQKPGYTSEVPGKPSVCLQPSTAT